MNRKENIRNLLGGQHFLERKSLLILAPYLVLTSLATAFIQSLDGSPWESQLHSFPWSSLLIANVISILVCWLFIEVLNATVIRGKSIKPLSLTAVITVSFAVGALKGYTTGIFGLWLEAFPTFAVAVSSRWLQGGILGVSSLPLLTLTVAKLSQMNAKREVLIADHVRAMLLGKIAPTKQLQRQVSELKQKSLEVLEALENSLPNLDRNAAAVFESTVQELLSNHIRPLSHTIWDERQRRLPRLSMPILLKAGILSRSVNPGISAGLLFLTLFMGHLATLPPELSLQRSLAMSLATSLSMWAYSWIKPHRVPLYVTGYGLVLVSSSALGIYLADVLFGKVPGGSFLLAWLITSLLSMQTILMANIGHQMITRDRDLDHELDELVSGFDIADKARSAYSTVMNRDYAQFLHSDVQNQLLISALSARQSEFDKDDLRREIRRLRRLFEGLETERPMPNQMNLGDVVSSLEVRWEGFLELTMRVSEDLRDLDYDRSWALVEVLNEAISNAIRHGVATRVEITIESLDECISVSVEDNGLGPTVGKSGLGTQIIDELTTGKWQLGQAENGGAKLTMKLPV